MAQPLVTVCVPSYNYARFLGSCLESVLSQSFGDFELLVVDDASSDESVPIAESYRDARMRVVRHQRNEGAVPTWNRCLALARGEFVCFLCADDWFLPGKLEGQVDALRHNPEAALVHSDAEWMDETGDRAGSGQTFRAVFPPALRVHLGEDHIIRPPEELRRLAAGYNYIHLSSALFRRQAAVELGCFDAGFPYAADWDLWLRLAARHSFAYLARPLTAIRRHSRNLTLRMQASGQVFRDWYGVLNRAVRDWPTEAGPVASVRAEAMKVVREHLVAHAHAQYARGETRAARRDLGLGFRYDPYLWVDGLTVATYVKALLAVPKVRRWLHQEKGHA